VSETRGAVAILLRVEQAVTGASLFVACCFMAAAAGVGFYQVLTRFVFSEPATSAITLATLVLLALLFWFGTALAYRVRFQILAGLEIPVTWGYAAVPAGALISMLAVLAHYFDPKREELENAV
jgi:TRAP-type C4-dicarboxylate transport system permease small subunit